MLKKFVQFSIIFLILNIFKRGFLLSGIRNNGLSISVGISDFLIILLEDIIVSTFIFIFLFIIGFFLKWLLLPSSFDDWNYAQIVKNIISKLSLGMVIMILVVCIYNNEIRQFGFQISKNKHNSNSLKLITMESEWKTVLRSIWLLVVSLSVTTLRNRYL